MLKRHNKATFLQRFTRHCNRVSSHLWPGLNFIGFSANSFYVMHLWFSAIVLLEGAGCFHQRAHSFRDPVRPVTGRTSPPWRHICKHQPETYLDGTSTDVQARKIRSVCVFLWDRKPFWVIQVHIYKSCFRGVCSHVGFLWRTAPRLHVPVKLHTRTSHTDSARKWLTGARAHTHKPRTRFPENLNRSFSHFRN